jgi:hypothetical protein
MKTNPRAWQIGGVLVVLLAAYLGWALMLRPAFADVRRTQAQTVATREQAQQVRAQAEELAAQEADLQNQIDALLRLRAKIPKDVNVPVLMRTIQAEARAEGVELDSLQPGQITRFEVVEPSPSPTQSGDSSQDGAAAAPAPAPSASNLGQGIAPADAGLAYVPLSLSGQGTYPAIRRLTARLEQQQRAFLITSLCVERATGDATAPLTFTMTARVFVLNAEEVQLPAGIRSGGE